jgi:hypothetical protein
MTHAETRSRGVLTQKTLAPTKWGRGQGEGVFGDQQREIRSQNGLYTYPLLISDFRSVTSDTPHPIPLPRESGGEGNSFFSPRLRVQHQPKGNHT